ncbi:MAG: cytochrome b6 [Chloroflexi bacterium]|nr:cytochrome b6 [Chloroflexota bacterium]
MTLKVGSWIDERAGTGAIWQAVFLRKIPKVNWLYALGSASLFVATMQFVTGILLTVYYVPTPDHAYDSVQYIMNDIAFGWLIRGLHHWGASAMVLLVFLHMLRVFYMGAYKFPREMTWVSGVFLLLLTIGFGFTGYLLPWDQKAYWATTVGTNIAGSVPLIGELVKGVLRGGENLTALTLARFFGTHVWVLPAILLLFITVHLYLVIKIGISAPPKE